MMSVNEELMYLKCKNCGAEIADERTICPECGEPLDDPGFDTPADSDTPAYNEAEESGNPVVDETTDGDETAAEQPSADESSVSAPKAKKRGMRSVVAIVLAAAVLLTFSAGLFFVLSDKKDPKKADTDKKTDTELKDDAPLPVAGTIVAKMGDHKLDNETFLFYYWDEFYYLYKQYGSNITYLLDPSKSLALQEVEKGTSWREYLTDRALKTWAQTMLLGDAAKKAGYALGTEEEAELKGIPDKLKTYAETNNFKDSLSYLQKNYDQAVTLEGYQEYLNGTYYASGFVNSQYEKFMEDYKDLADQKKFMVNVRHILIEPEDKTDAGKGKAKLEAERIYKLWQEKPTEDNFSVLAKEYSTDTGSNANGGLYNDIEPGKMTQAFNDWCFTEGRKAGDHGIVETEFGYHIMFFSGFSTTAYETEQQTAAGKDYDEWIGKLLKKADYKRTDKEIGFSR